MTEPAGADCGRHADKKSCFLRQQSRRHVSPERRLDRPLELGMPGRPKLRSNRLVCCLLSSNHRTPPDEGVATTD
ncbi:hypothetical protein ACFPRL_13465 [Pseudoclavibacter helvolus]